jgi:uncharacterized metal-binding protein YceD (DUF177 family)
VVTLEPFPVAIDESVEILYSRAAEEHGSGEVDIRDVAEADPLPEGGLDIGEAISEELALALDPFPRKPGAALPEQFDAEAESSGQGSENKDKKSPFEALATLRRKD